MNDPQTDLPVPDPGLEEHPPRFTDVDDAAADRAYKQIVGMLAAVPVLVVAFLVVYFAVPRDAELVLFGANLKMQTTLLGLTAGVATLLIGISAIHWARMLMSDEEIVGDRHGAASPPEARERVLTDLETGIEKTIWAEGVHLVNDVTFTRLKATELVVGQLVNAQPETLQEYHGAALQQQKAKASIIVVRMDPNSIRIPESRRDWQVDGILCYSKICTHVGCPISLWEQQTHHLLCPCHQSTFDLGNSGVVVFGPAARALPQLPITTDAEGYLVARSDFTVPVGPSYFERDSSKDFQEGDR
ncbi:MAG: Rieske (2Fe-2S) protein [Actinobacteria bacterium]|nr:Rieske (2Fe-2S) protein [Actinomycetota bacterium]